MKTFSQKKPLIYISSLWVKLNHSKVIMNRLMFSLLSLPNHIWEFLIIAAANNLLPWAVLPIKIMNNHLHKLQVITSIRMTNQEETTFSKIVKIISNKDFWTLKTSLTLKKRLRSLQLLLEWQVMEEIAIWQRIARFSKPIKSFWMIKWTERNPITIMWPRCNSRIPIQRTP